MKESNVVDMDSNTDLRWNARVRLAGQYGQKDSVRALERLLLLGGVDVAADYIPNKRVRSLLLVQERTELLTEAECSQHRTRVTAPS